MRNPTLMQFFHWYYPPGGTLWGEAAERAGWLAEIGITMVWLPPAYKADTGADSVGYDTYDLFDLGEFDQKGGHATKYGDKAALLAAIEALKSHDIGVLLDVVLNHKMGADEQERIQVNRVEIEDREEIEERAIDATAWTRFTFPARQGQYSRFVWDHKCFSGIDLIEDPDEKGIFKIVTEYTRDGWNEEVDDELGNYDYLMGANIEFRNPAVAAELAHWGRWVMNETHCTGFRLDAVKHIPAWFYKDWIDHIQDAAGQPMFIIAEYWSHKTEILLQYLEQVDGKTMLFDAPLQMNFHRASTQGAEFDLSQVFADTLVAADPAHAVTLVDNHDTQPLQSLEAPVQPWFKPLAYALILLREQGVPTVFYPDLFGASYADTGNDGEIHAIEMPAIPELEALIRARRLYAHGRQTDYFDDAHCVAFRRHGTDRLPGCVVVMSNSGEGEKKLELGAGFAQARWRDHVGQREDIVTLDEHGAGIFRCNAAGVSVWIDAG
ncbi:alpha-amylase [Acerihabitans arboris]|uniref:Alpha-amylase n=1 Tax=Acerihabitans arboris TaxID=2691583 RepID=A0A845SCX0_9GAMM|nr:alpha-amylase [Acerihabitans arboris]NDL61749.1 alpha-amylase [Acerihabitans arboris]